MAVTFRYDNREAMVVGDAIVVEAAATLPSGSYTTLRTYGGNGVVRLEQHVRRLIDSLPAEVAFRGASLDSAAVRPALARALRETGNAESRVRITYAPPAVFLTVEPFTPLDESMRQQGVACVTVPARRERPEAKDTRFLATARAAYAGLPAGIHEGLLVGEDGAILEGLSSNFFAVHEGTLRTEETRALRGVTRSVVLEIAARILPRGEGAMRLDDIGVAEECFITSVSREVLPVVRVDGVVIGDGAAGPVTREIIRRFEAAIENELERLP